jgi:enolase
MKVVNQILTMRVDYEGKKSTYDRDSDKTYLAWAVQDSVQKAVKEAIQTHIGMHAERIKIAIDAEMRKNKSPLVQNLINSMAEGIAKAAGNRYGITVVFKDEG